MAQFAVLISAGSPEYRRIAGWDDLHVTRAEAEDCAERARSQEGWSARVIEVDEASAQEWNEPVGDRLARERREHLAGLRGES